LSRHARALYLAMTGGGSSIKIEVCSRRRLDALDIAGRPGGRFARHHAGEELAALDRAGVDPDRDRERDAVGVGSERTLLCLQHHLVLVEGAHDAITDDLVERAVIHVELTRDAPEVVRA